MKIVLATPMYPPEIAEPASYVKKVSLRLAASHDVTVVAYGNTALETPGIKLVTVNKRTPLPIRLALYTRALIREVRDADTIYTQSGIAGSLPALIASHFCRIPLIVRFTDDEAYERARSQNITQKTLSDFLAKPDGGMRMRLMVSLQKFIFRNANHIITSSVSDREILIHGYGVPGGNISTIYNPAPTQEILPFPPSRKAHQIATITKLTETSGVKTLLESIKILKESFPDLHLLIIGRGPKEAEYRELTHTLNIEKHVTFLPQISRAEEWDIRANSEVFVYTPETPESPDHVVPCFITKTSVIVSDVPGPSEAVTDKQSGLVVSPKDAKGLSQAIETLFKDQTLKNHCIKGGTLTLDEQFSWETHMGKISEILEKTRG